jgi:hypothetical protein
MTFFFGLQWKKAVPRTAFFNFAELFEKRSRLPSKSKGRKQAACFLRKSLKKT